MNTPEALRLSLDLAEFVAMLYLEDLTDDEMLHRPAAGANHIKWQLGHLITSEHQLIEKVVPGAMPPLPEGFAERYSRANATSDDPTQFDTKAELLRVYREQRDATLTALGSLSDADFDVPSGIEYAPTVGAIFSMQGGHYSMHAGQWVVIRRQLGRPPLF